MHDCTNKPDNPLRPKTGGANIALMIVQDWPNVAPLESELMRQGFQVLRAQHAMHGYWLAMTLRPNVIVTDFREVESSSHGFLRYLKGSDKTCAIPIVYLSDRATAELADRLRRRGVMRCLPTDVAPARLAGELMRLLQISMLEDTTKIDAVFSEMGSEFPTTRATASSESTPSWLPHRVDRDALSESTRSASPHGLKGKSHGTRHRQLRRLVRD